MTSRFLAVFLLAVSISARAQVGVNSLGANPDGSAMLDVSAADKGLLIPRIALTGTNDVTTVVSPATSLLVYNTASVSDVTPGFYYYNGAAWKRLVSGIETDPVFTSVIDVSGSLTADLLKYDGTKYVKFTPNFTESNFLYNSRYGVKLLARNDAQPNVDFVLSPKGNASILAQQPDGTTDGGNIRGRRALDLQLLRTSATQVASGNYSITIGANNTASQIWSTAIGVDNTASGIYSYALGYDNIAQSWGETVLGFKATIGTGSYSAPIPTDRLFVIGNGDPISTIRSDALTILKNANTTIGGSLTINGNGTGTSLTLPATRGTSGNVLTTDGIGGTSWTTPASSQWTTNGSNIYFNTGYVGIGVATPYAPLQFDNTLVNRKLVLWSTLNNDHQYYGFGVNASTLRYQVQSTSDSHVFYAGTSTTTSTELFRIKGTGQIVIPALTIKGVLLNNALGEVSSTIGTNGQVLTTNSSGEVSWTTPAVGTVTGVTGAAPIVSSGGVTPAISISAATTSAAGSMSAADKTKLDAITGTNTGNQTITLTGDVTGSGTGTFAATISSASVTNARMANMAANTIKANNTASAAAPGDLSLTANTFPSRKSTGNITANAITDFAFTMLDDADAAAVRTTIGAGIGNGTVTGVTGTAPISVVTGTTTPVVSIAAATTSAAGSMSAADKTKLDGLVDSQWTTSGSNIYYNTGFIGIGTTAPKATLDLGNGISNRKISLYATADNDHQFYGFGVNNGVLRLQLANSTANCKFYAANSTSTSTELFRIQGDGQIVIPALTAQGIVQNSATGVLNSSKGTANQVLKMNSDGTAAEWGNATPILTQVQRDGLNPAEGLIIYNLTTHKPNYYNGTEWMNYDGTTAATLEIGHAYQGGIIAYVYQSGDPGYISGETHGLIAATVDQNTGIQWYNGSSVATGATATALGTGSANTSAIVNIQGVGSYAAQICDDYTAGGYTDWFLPSKNELNKLYLNNAAIGGFDITSYYWSSTEYSSPVGWRQNFGSGNQYAAAKSLSSSVRAVRFF